MILLPLLALLAQDPALEDALRAHPAGLAVVVGADDPALVLRIAEGGRRIVHVLESDEGRRRALREAAVEAKAGGLVAIEPWEAPVLPHAEHLADLVVVVREIAEGEALRVLAPGGTALVRGEGRWTSLRKPRPDGFDDWTHWRHGPDGNMVSRDREVAAPQGLRWVAGPAQDAGGRKWYYDHVLLTANGRNIHVFEEAIVARNSWNGVILWTRPFKTHVFRETGLPLPADAPPKLRLGTRPSKVRPALAGDRLFAATEGKLLELDARTGETAAEFGQVTNPREILLDGGLLVVSDHEAIRAFDLASRAPVWEAPVAARRVVAGDGRLFAAGETRVTALDRATGKVLWSAEDPDVKLAATCTYGAGRLVLEKSTFRDDGIGCGIRVYDAATGELAWMRDYKPDMTHYKESRAYFARGLLWIQVEKERLLGLDPKSGSERREWKSRGKHCASPVATERFFMAPECEFTDLETGAQSRARMFKSACRLPFIPANGLLYTFPVQCECWPMLRGYMALSSGPPREIAAGPRRVGGGEAPAAALLLPAKAAEEWPTYRHDALRSGATPMPLKDDLKVAWERSAARTPDGPAADDWKGNPYVGGPLTPPTVAAGRVFVAAPDLHRLDALDARTGAPLWSFHAGARIDGPPTVHDGLCLFGAHDGWVYAVRAEDGILAWRFRAAPREARIAAYGQVESPWPVVGSVLVDGGLAYAAAGRHPAADGGVRVVALRPRTGELVWEKAVDQIEEIKRWYGGTLPSSKTKIGLDFEPVDLLVRDGDKVAMSRWRFEPAAGGFGMEMANVTYPAPGGLSVPRGLWGYGIRQTKLVHPKPPAVFGDGRIHVGAKGDVALLLAGGRLVTATAAELRIGERRIPLPAEPVHDGLAAAYGRLYVSTRAGTLLCFE